MCIRQAIGDSAHTLEPENDQLEPIRLCPVLHAHRPAVPLLLRRSTLLKVVNRSNCSKTAQLENELVAA